MEEVQVNELQSTLWTLGPMNDSRSACMGAGVIADVKRVKRRAWERVAQEEGLQLPRQQQRAERPGL